MSMQIEEERKDWNSQFKGIDHVAVRALERYGLCLTPHDIVVLELAISQGVLGRVQKVQSTGRKIIQVSLGGRDCDVVYEPLVRQIITFLRPEKRKAQQRYARNEQRAHTHRRARRRGPLPVRRIWDEE